MTPNEWNSAVVVAARSWIGTPYRHQASRKGVGCDCLGLLRGVWRDLLGPEPEAPPPYTPDWAELTATEPLLEAASRWLIPTDDEVSGTVLVLRWSAGSAAKHCGIVSGGSRMIHAYSGHGTVESPLHGSWRRRIVGRFLFPLSSEARPLLQPSERP